MVWVAAEQGLEVEASLKHRVFKVKYFTGIKMVHTTGEGTSLYVPTLRFGRPCVTLVTEYIHVQCMSKLKVTDIHVDVNGELTCHWNQPRLGWFKSNIKLTQD